ncbi:single Ig IL-1-related receptor isoform X2 [Mustela nigripes]|uniref:single Ig IL-1-related receptor isoform X2 n=1 Tax=Mustela nigripes TaxID=77151 RepID=UPI002816450C|nr:single Ig IL-1-related receptor isoform X2 [Mustela nigripes]
MGKGLECGSVLILFSTFLGLPSEGSFIEVLPSLHLGFGAGVKAGFLEEELGRRGRTTKGAPGDSGNCEESLGSKTLGLVGLADPVPPGWVVAAPRLPGACEQDSLKRQTWAQRGTLGSALRPWLLGGAAPAAAGLVAAAHLAQQPLTRPGALTDRPQRQRVSLARPPGDSSAHPRSPVEPGGGTCAQAALRRPRPDHGICDRAPEFLSPTGNQALEPALGSVVALNCTAWVVSGPHCSPPSVQWLKDRLPLGNGSHYDLHEDSWVKDNFSEVLVSSILGVKLTRAEDYGAFTCSIRNVSSSPFTLRRAGPAGHVAAVLASLLVLLVLLLAALLYVKCRLSVLLWYQDAYGEVEMNDGKLYDAYVSYSDSPEDRKFVNFILKPQLERRRGYKLFLDDRDLLPRAEPSADLLVNLSRCRRLIVVLSDAFLGQAWCSHSFREGLCRLLELTRRPIFITFEGQRRDPAHPALRLLRQHRHLVTLLLWRPGSVAPSSDFWKELQLALPRKVRYRAAEGDPQTRLQDDKDPMLIAQGRVRERGTLSLEQDPDPEGDLGVRGPVFGEPLAPPHASGVSLGEGRASEVDVSDLGSRNYSARTDFYCLVSEDDV